MAKKAKKKTRSHGGPRQNAGRKNLFDEPAQGLYLTLPVAMWRKIDQIAEATDRPRAKVVRDLLVRAMSE